VMMIRLNAFITIKPYFKSFPVFRVPLVGDSRSRSELARMLFDNGVAHAYPHEEYLYFKGKQDETLRVLEEVMARGVIQGKLVLGPQLEKLNLTVHDGVVIKPIVYLAFEKVLESKGFKVPRRGVKRAIPEISDENVKRGLITPLAGDIAVLRGLKYMFEVRPSGYGILWLDIYSPPFSLRNMKRLSHKEVKRLNLMESYHRKAVLKSKDRLTMLSNIINSLCDGTRILTLKFPDGDIIQFSMELLQLEAIEREWQK